MKTIILYYYVTMEMINLVYSGCILHTYGDSLSSVDCIGLTNLENIKPLTTKGVLTINVTESELPILPAGSFDNFRELRRIFLSGNAIEEIERGVFSTETNRSMLPFLMVLDLSENNIEKLESETFNHSTALELNLSSNGLKEIEIGAFRNMKMLKKLDLSYNEISTPEAESEAENTFPLGVFEDVPRLEKLNLSYNGLKTIRIGTFSMLPFLFVLDLSHNELTRLPGGLFIGSAIQELYLNDNNLVFFEYPNARNIHAVINLLNNDFECEFLADAIGKMSNGLFTKGSALSEPNIYGIACNEEDSNADSNGSNDDTTEEDILGELNVLKYLSIATLILGLILGCYVLFCQKSEDDDENDDATDDSRGRAVLKEVTHLE